MVRSGSANLTHFVEIVPKIVLLLPTPRDRASMKSIQLHSSADIDDGSLRYSRCRAPLSFPQFAGISDAGVETSKEEKEEKRDFENKSSQVSKRYHL
jgi:hypothetical protein